MKRNEVIEFIKKEDDIEWLEAFNKWIDSQVKFLKSMVEIEKSKLILNTNIPYYNHWEMYNIVEIKELDFSNEYDMKTLVEMVGSKKWVVLEVFYKNGSHKPPFISVGRII